LSVKIIFVSGRFLYFLMIFFPHRGCVLLDGSVIINELKETWNDVVVPNRKVLSQYLSRPKKMENHKKASCNKWGVINLCPDIWWHQIKERRWASIMVGLLYSLLKERILGTDRIRIWISPCHSGGGCHCTTLNTSHLYQ